VIPKLKGLSLALVVLSLLTAQPASAHTMGVSRGEYIVRGDVVTATLLFRAEELRAATTEVDLVSELAIDTAGAPCPGAFVSTAPDAPDGVRIIARFSCPTRPTLLHVHAGFLARFPSGHAHVVAIDRDDGAPSEHLVVLARPDALVDLGAPPSPGFMGFVLAGIEHILTGADHLLFLLGLVLLPRDAEASRRDRIKALVFVLTAFTIGHSVSLAIATLGGHAPSARIVEPLVALSVAYVGAENLWARASRLRRRWLITFPFGLVHGFAFASGLLLVGLPRKELPLALVGFNTGVEIGQLGVMTLVLPALFLLARKARAYDTVRVVLSVAVLVCGLVWFVQRIV
jgi:hydrogenase/urease accessory protein HupE